MISVFLALVLLTNATFVTSDYACVCCYNNQVFVHDSPSATSAPVGLIQMLDCKPLYATVTQGPKFIAILFNGKVGYVANDGFLAIQSCQGDPSTSDMVTTSTIKPTTAPVETTTSTTTSSTTIKTTTFQSSPQTTTQSRCNTGWLEFQSSCYLFKTDANDGTTFHDAKMFCENHGSHLAFIGSQEEQSFIFRHATLPASEDRTGTNDYAWIGGSDENSEGHFMWWDHANYIQMFSYSNWRPGEPNDRGNQDCLATSRVVHGIWDDKHCSQHLPFVCEHSPSVSCDHGWVAQGDTCYLFRVNDHMTWTQASSKCAEFGGHLVFIENEDEQTFIHDYLRRHFDNHHDDLESSWWIGATDTVHEGQWTWVDSRTQESRTVVHYTLWSSGHPRTHGDNDDDCVAVTGTHAYHWTDYPCSTKLTHICEKPP